MLASNLFQIQNIVVAPALISFWTLPGRWHLRDVCLAPCVVFASPVSPFASVCTEDAKTYVPVENSNEKMRSLGSLQIKPQGNSWICLKSMMDFRERSTTTIFAPGIVGSGCVLLIHIKTDNHCAMIATVLMNGLKPLIRLQWFEGLRIDRSNIAEKLWKTGRWLCYILCVSAHQSEYMTVKDAKHVQIRSASQRKMSLVQSPPGNRISWHLRFNTALWCVLNMCWVCLGYVCKMHGICLNMSWKSIGYRLNGICMEYVLTMYWIRIKCVYWICIEHVLNMYRVCIEYVSSMYRVCIEYVLNMYWIYIYIYQICVEYVLNMCWISIKYLLNICWVNWVSIEYIYIYIYNNYLLAI